MRKYELLYILCTGESPSVTDAFRLLLRRALLNALRERGVLTEREASLCFDRLCRTEDAPLPTGGEESE